MGMKWTRAFGLVAVTLALVACGGAVDAPASDAGSCGTSDAPAPYCGDGHRDPGEGCDDGNDVPSDGCTNCVPDDAQLLHLDGGEP